MFPLERIRPYMGLPVCGWSLWKYNHCPFTTPLIRKDRAREGLAALFQWLSSPEAGGHLLEWRYVLGEGTFYQLLVDQLHDMGSCSDGVGVVYPGIFQADGNSGPYFGRRYRVSTEGFQTENGLAR